jgi:hypothetical protein
MIDRRKKTKEDKLRLGNPETRLLNILLRAKRPMFTQEMADAYFQITGKVTKFPHIYVTTVARSLAYKTQNNPESEVIVMRSEPRGGKEIETWVEKRRKV